MNAALKRGFDLLASAAALLLLWPLLLVIAMLIKLDSPGPVLFRQSRLGKEGRIFHLLKFRTMVQNAERRGPSITTHRDPRITRIGHLLRRFDLDELPSLWNVLRGEMSIVGPRPEVPKFLPYYTGAFRQALAVRPGLTDPATLAFRQEAAWLDGDAEDAYTRDILPRKLALQVEYARTQRLITDLAVIGRTLRAILLQRKG